MNREQMVQPVNENFLALHRFQVVLQRTPNVTFYCQEANLPGISMGNASQPTPFVDVPVPGDKIVFEDFVMNFVVDEDMLNYKEISSWIVQIGFPRSFRQYKYPNRSYISLIILDSNNQSNHTVMFHDAFPVSLSGITFDTKSIDTIYAYATATFKYSFYEFDEVNSNPDQFEV